MDLLMNGLLTVATLFAGGYCWVLSRRVRDLKSLDKGLGGSIVTLTRQIELARTTLDEARAVSKASKQDLALLVGRADAAAGQLRLLLAAAPAVPTAAAPAPAPAAAVVPQQEAPRQEALTAAPGPELVIVPETATEAPDALRRPARKAGPLMSMFSKPAPAPAPEPELAPKPVAEAAPDVPKPRVLVPIENPLRRFRPDAPEPVGSEEDILEALRALAGTER